MTTSARACDWRTRRMLDVEHALNRDAAPDTGGDAADASTDAGADVAADVATDGGPDATDAKAE